MEKQFIFIAIVLYGPQMTVYRRIKPKGVLKILLYHANHISNEKAGEETKVMILGDSHSDETGSTWCFLLWERRKKYVKRSKKP